MVSVLHLLRLFILFVGVVSLIIFIVSFFVQSIEKRKWGMIFVSCLLLNFMTGLLAGVVSLRDNPAIMDQLNEIENNSK